MTLLARVSLAGYLPKPPMTDTNDFAAFVAAHVDVVSRFHRNIQSRTHRIVKNTFVWKNLRSWIVLSPRRFALGSQTMTRRALGIRGGDRLDTSGKRPAWQVEDLSKVFKLQHAQRTSTAFSQHHARMSHLNKL